jgi:hypothetical protein
MGELFGYTLIAAWFIFWGYIIVTKPEVFFKFQQQGDERLEGAARVGTKIVGTVIKAAAKTRK